MIVRSFLKKLFTLTAHRSMTLKNIRNFESWPMPRSSMIKVSQKMLFFLV